MNPLLLADNDLALEPGTQILFFVLLFLVAIALIFLLVRSSLKERRRYLAEKSKEKTGSLSIEEFDVYITNQILYNKKDFFAMFRIDVFQSAMLIKNLGEVQYISAFEELTGRIIKTLGLNTKYTVENDETIIIYHKTKLAPETLNNLCKLLIREAKKSIVIAGSLKVDFDINLGYVIFPESGKSVTDLKDNLQLALVASKRQGVNSFYAYDATLSNRETEEYKTFMEIKSAIESKEFTLYFQPIVDTDKNEVFCAESLLRWKHRERGVLPPSTFLNIIEHTGDINWVGFWALEQLFKQHQQWSIQYPDNKILLNINLSPRQLMNPRLGDEVYRLVKKNKVEASNFCLELTQESLLSASDSVKESIKKLSDMGFVIAVDNYGSSSTSLEILSDFPISMIKLSRAFWLDAQSNELKRDVIRMLVDHCEKNEMSIIAEGIEDTNHLEFLREIGIRNGQGYFFAKPGAPSELMNAVILTPWVAS